MDPIARTGSGADLAISRVRIVLSLIALISIYVDPSNDGWFDITGYSLAVLSCYFLYSLMAYTALRRWPAPSYRYLSLTAVLDVVFAAAVALVTEGPTSPSWLFFVFAILAVNLRTEFRAGTLITLCCSAIYLVLLMIAAPGREFEMRAAYLAIIGYLIRFFGEENVRLERTINDLETERQRQQIARILHDGYIQALASVNLQLDTCRKLLKNGRATDALGLVEDIQAGVRREYDEVRAFVRSLASVSGASSDDHLSASATCFEVTTRFKAHGLMPEQVLLIMVEAMRNTRKHAAANFSSLSVSQSEDKIHIAIDDDGSGFTRVPEKPWTIASRVAECGGTLQIDRDHQRGTHIRIELAE